MQVEARIEAQPTPMPYQILGGAEGPKISIAFPKRIALTATVFSICH
jgi:hypothetical protein